MRRIPSYNEIATRAFALWEAAGRPESGDARAYWHTAEQLLAGEAAEDTLEHMRLMLQLTICRGETLVLMTDGVGEALRADGETYGMDRALTYVRQWLDEPAARIAEAVAEEADDFGTGYVDDITVVVVKRGEESGGGG